MSLTARKVFSADVRLAGLADEPDATDAVAQVDFRAHGRSEQPRDLAAFLTMTVVATLRGCRSAPTHAAPFIDICDELADALLGWDPGDGQTFSLREAVGEPVHDAETLAFLFDDGNANEEMIDTWLRQCLPRVSSKSGGGKRRRFRATMKQPQRAGSIAFVAPMSRNSFLAIEGTLAMFEAAAQTRDYSSTVRPAAATLRRTLDFNAEMFGGQIPEFGEATWLYQLAAVAAVAEDPLTCPLPRFAGTDSSGEEAVMLTKIGRWAREAGLDPDAAVLEIGRRMDAGEPMPWDDEAPAIEPT